MTLNVRWLSRDHVRQAGGGDPMFLAPPIENALMAHAAGASCQPLKPYLRIPDDTQARRIIAMPAYLGEPFQSWGIKWIASSPNNPTERGIERASAIIILNDLASGVPVVMMEGALISASRTAAVALVAARRLTKPNPKTLACLGTGMIGGLIVRTLLREFDTLETVQLFDQSPAHAGRLGSQLEEDFEIRSQVAETAKDVLQGADLVVTATTASEGYIEGEWLEPGSLFLNVSLRDPKLCVAERADKLVVDDWDQVNRGGTIIHKMTEAGRLDRDGLHAQLAEILSGAKSGRDSDEEIILFSPMGLPVVDLAAAWGVYQEAERQDLGQRLDLY